MDHNNRDHTKRILATILCALLSFAFIPETVCAADEQTDEVSLDGLVLVETERITIAPDEPLEDGDALLEGYMDSRIDEELGSAKEKSGMRKAAASKRRNTLNDKEKIIYDGIKAFADRVASGQEFTAITIFNAAAVFSGYYVRKGNYYAMTSESLGISSPVLIAENGKWHFSEEAAEKLNDIYDFSAIFKALLADEPYAFYWFDKTAGAVCGPYGGGFQNVTGTSDFYFNGEPSVSPKYTVSKDYRASSDEYSVNKSKTGATARAVQNALNIITDKTAGSDYERLIAYKDSICDLTSYNDEAAADESMPYGDPWQMIYVFDGDPKTKVVCEGYSKAFQYLCDHTDFDKNIECDSVTGDMGKTPEKMGRHMWNILHMEDGRNYLADVTNSDTGMIGSGGGLFISSAMANGSVTSGYSFDTNKDGSADLLYEYDNNTKNIFNESELTLSTDPYDTPHVVKDATYTWADDKSSCSAKGKCKDCGEVLSEEATITSKITKQATCTENGVTTYIATFNERGFRTQRKAIENIPSYGGHTWNGGVQVTAPTESSEGSRTYTCTRCGQTYTETIGRIMYPTDLPAVKISKPKTAKKKITVKWKKVSKKNQKKIQGVEIQVATDPAFTNIVKTATASKKKTSKAIKGLNSGTKYYVRIRSYRNASDGKHVSSWKSKSIKAK